MTDRRRSLLLAFLVCALLPLGCGQKARIETGLWRAVLTLPGGELPFGLELREEKGEAAAFLVNGEERVPVSDVEIDGRDLSMRMPGYANRLRARLKSGTLRGEVVMVKAGGEEQRIPFSAEHGAAWRFFEAPTTDNADVSGRWAVSFRDKDGKEARGVAEFEQKFAGVTGTFLLPTGDHGYLAGEMRGDELYLSGFDGGHAFLHRARVGSDGELTGTFWSGLKASEQWRARRDENAALADPDAITRVSDATWNLGFTFPDENGQPISIADGRFRNKVLIVALAGSWCPNCHDEAAFLAPLYRKHRGQGLEVISLMFEHVPDFEDAAEAVKAFRGKFGIEYATLIAGSSDKTEAAARLPLLNGVFAYPTTIFIDRTGRVRRIHTGFTGPATGEHFEKLKRSFTELVEALLAERAT